jgi:hypothetical protein
MSFDLTEGRRLRDEGHDRVTQHNERWHDRAMAELLKFAGSGQLMRGEEMRALIVECVGHPEHHNAWGALVRHACLAGIIDDTGSVSPAQSKKSHARRMPIWRFK